MKSIFFLLTVLVGTCIYGMDQTRINGETPETPLKYDLRAKERYVLDEPVNIEFTIKNVIDETLWMLQWYTPLEGVKGDIFTVLCNDKKISYEGPMVKRGDPSRKDYIQLKPEESVSGIVNLSLVYNFSEPGECKVEFKGRIYDIVHDESLLPRKRDEHQRIDVSGSAIIFHLASR